MNRIAFDNVPTESLRDENVLLVDDVTNTGSTLDGARALIASGAPAAVRTTALFWDTVDPKSDIPLAHCAAEFVGKTVYAWLAFPWEMKDE
jgi:hypoxanthine phosphoribosyltransferase